MPPSAARNTPKEAPAAPGSARDAIVADFIQSEAGNFISVHAPDLYDAEGHRDNNVAFGDGHAETHLHEVDMMHSSPLGATPGWDEHYVTRNWGGEIRLY